MVIKSRMGTISRGLFFIVVCLILGFLISFVYAQFTFKTKDAGGTLQNRFVVNQGAATVDIDIFNATLDMNSNTIKNVANPTAAQDAATKNYVDGKAHVPSGAVIFFLSNFVGAGGAGTCPTGYTNITATYNDRFPLTCSNCQGGVSQAGTNAHTHTIPAHAHGNTTGTTNISHQHTVSDGWAGALHGTGGHGSGSYYCFGNNNPTGASTLTSATNPGGGHNHSIPLQASTNTGSPSDGYPKYFTVIICRKD